MLECMLLVSPARYHSPTLPPQHPNLSALDWAGPSWQPIVSFPWLAIFVTQYQAIKGNRGVKCSKGIIVKLDQLDFELVVCCPLARLQNSPAREGISASFPSILRTGGTGLEFAMFV